MNIYISVNIYCDICSLARLLSAVYNWRSRHPSPATSNSSTHGNGAETIGIYSLKSSLERRIGTNGYIDHFDSVAAVNGWDGDEAQVATRAPNWESSDYIQTAPRSDACRLLSCYECVAEEVRTGK